MELLGFWPLELKHGTANQLAIFYIQQRSSRNFDFYEMEML